MKSRTFSLALISALLAGASLGAMAQTGDNGQFNQNHPRRAEVNNRLNNQDKRINREERSGQISRGQARAEHREDHNMRKEERRMARRDGGHITKADQHKLNRQENGVSRQIGK